MDKKDVFKESVYDVLIINSLLLGFYNELIEDELNKKLKEIRNGKQKIRNQGLVDLGIK